MMDAVPTADKTVSPSEDALPFSADAARDAHGAGPSIGVVVSHGFTGTPASMRPWAEHLAAAGFSVRLPLLPGHGRSWRETNRSRWPQWYAAIEDAYLDLAERCDVVFAVGLSMGGTLVTRLAEQHPDVAGLVLVNPAYGTKRLDAKLAPYFAKLIRSRPAIGGDIKKPGVAEEAADRTPVIAFASLQQLWKVTVKDFAALRVPVLLYRSSVDHVVDDLSPQLLQKRAVNASVRKVMLHDSYHVATLDNDAQTIFTGSVEFIRGVLAERTSAP